jgi:hypothetical protein
VSCSALAAQLWLLAAQLWLLAAQLWLLAAQLWLLSSGCSEKKIKKLFDSGCAWVTLE